METRTQLFKLLEEKNFLSEEIQKMEGPGLFKKLRRLFRYRSKYLRYCYSKFKPCLIKTKTFWGDDFLSFLPEGFDFYLFGTISHQSELNLTKFFIKNLKDDSIFYDIGANYGYYSLLAKKIIRVGEIHSFEPVPKTFKYLSKNLFNARGIFLNQLAVFNKKIEIDFYDMETAGIPGSSTFNLTQRHREFSLKSANPQKIQVQTITLDDYCNNYSKPTFLKIDVEGAEGEVIEGGIETLKQGNPIIAMEVWNTNNESHLRAINILYELGYKSYKINNEGELEFIEKINPEKDISKEHTLDNFIFKK